MHIPVQDMICMDDDYEEYLRFMDAMWRIKSRLENDNGDDEE